MTASLFWLASAISFLISSELLALAVKTRIIARAPRSARTIASWKFSPGPMSRDEIQHETPRCSSASHNVRATLSSRDEWLMKTVALTLSRYWRRRFLTRKEAPSILRRHERRLGPGHRACRRAARVVGLDLLQLLAVRRADGGRARLEPHRARRRALRGAAAVGRRGLSGGRVDRPRRWPRGDEPRLGARGRFCSPRGRASTTSARSTPCGWGWDWLCRRRSTSPPSRC